jgi:hypothetical protein
MGAALRLSRLAGVLDARQALFHVYTAVSPTSSAAPPSSSATGSLVRHTTHLPGSPIETRTSHRAEWSHQATQG